MEGQSINTIFATTRAQSRKVESTNNNKTLKSENKLKCYETLTESETRHMTRLKLIINDNNTRCIFNTRRRSVVTVNFKSYVVNGKFDLDRFILRLEEEAGPK